MRKASNNWLIPRKNDSVSVPQAVEYDFLGVHIRIIHFSQDFLKPLIQVFRHNGTPIA